MWFFDISSYHKKMHSRFLRVQDIFSITSFTFWNSPNFHFSPVMTVGIWNFNLDGYFRKKFRKSIFAKMFTGSPDDVICFLAYNDIKGILKEHYECIMNTKLEGRKNTAHGCKLKSALKVPWKEPSSSLKFVYTLYKSLDYFFNTSVLRLPMRTRRLVHSLANTIVYLYPCTWELSIACVVANKAHLQNYKLQGIICVIVCYSQNTSMNLGTEIWYQLSVLDQLQHEKKKLRTEYDFRAACNNSHNEKKKSYKPTV